MNQFAQFLVKAATERDTDTPEPQAVMKSEISRNYGVNVSIRRVPPISPPRRPSSGLEPPCRRSGYGAPDGVTDRLWDVDDLVAAWEASERKEGKTGCRFGHIQASDLLGVHP